MTWFKRLFLLVLCLACTSNDIEETPPDFQCSNILTSSNGMSYCRGHVFQSAHVVTIYWSSDTIYRNAPTPGTIGLGSQDTSLIGYFLNHLAPSPWYNAITTYTGPLNTPFLNSLTYDHYWANNQNVPSDTIGTIQTEAMLQTGLSTGKLTYDSNTVYVIFPPQNVRILVDGCGFHAASLARPFIYYAVIPYAFNTDCEAANAQTSVNQDPAVDAILTSLAHEIVETATDPLPFWGWHESNGTEIMDKCNRAYGDNLTNDNGRISNITLGTKRFLIQGIWVNDGAGSCVIQWPNAHI